MVGDIASRYLTAEAHRQVAVLLERDRLADGQPSHRRTLGEIASWADEIKDYPWSRRYGAWHYDNAPLCGQADPARYCRRGACASAQLERQLQVLGDPARRLRDRNEALKWVVHLTGDIHQPLHTADHRDQGGNRVEVSFFGSRDNPPYGTIRLHTIWDIQMVERLVAERGGEAAIASARISGEQRTRWEQGTIADWMGESHAIARELVYPALPVAFACTRKIRGIVPVDERYYARAAPVIEDQIRKAGVRLARLLNETLGRSTSSGQGR